MILLIYKANAQKENLTMYIFLFNTLLIGIANFAKALEQFLITIDMSKDSIDFLIFMTGGLLVLIDFACMVILGLIQLGFVIRSFNATRKCKTKEVRTRWAVLLVMSVSLTTYEIINLILFFKGL